MGLVNLNLVRLHKFPSFCTQSYLREAVPKSANVFGTGRASVAGEHSRRPLATGGAHGFLSQLINLLWRAEFAILAPP